MKDGYALNRIQPGFIPEDREHLWPAAGKGEVLVGYIPEGETATESEPKPGRKRPKNG